MFFLYLETFTDTHDLDHVDDNVRPDKERRKNETDRILKC